MGCGASLCLMPKRKPLPCRKGLGMGAWLGMAATNWRPQQYLPWSPRLLPGDAGGGVVGAGARLLHDADAARRAIVRVCPRLGDSVVRDAVDAQSRSRSGRLVGV